MRHGLPRLAARLGLVLGCLVQSCTPSASGNSARGALPPPSTFPVRDVYTTTPAPDGVRGGRLAEDLARKVADHFDPLHLEPDGKLAEIAERTAILAQKFHRSPSSPELDSITRDAGFVGPPPAVVVLPWTGSSWERLDEYLAAAPANLRFTHYGVSVLDFDGAIAGAMAFGAEHVTLDPVERHVPKGGRITLRGALETDYAEAELVWTHPDGNTERRRPGGKNVAFESPPLAEGVHRFEILAVGPSGLEVVANFPVSSGVSSPEAAIEDQVPEGSDPKLALLALIARDRQRAGVPPLEESPALDGVAEGHSRDMVAAHFFGHQSPTTGVVDDRLRAAGLRLGFFGENVAKAPTVTEAHEMLLSSPGHRDNILNRRFSHVGIGIAEERIADGRVLAVTEVFGAYPRPLTDPIAAATATIDALNRSRGDARLPPLVRSPVLDAAAADVAALVVANPLTDPGGNVDPVLKRRLTGTRFRRTLVLTAFPVDPTDAARDERLRDESLRFAGAAVAQFPPAGAPEANVVVLVVAR